MIKLKGKAYAQSIPWGSEFIETREIHHRRTNAPITMPPSCNDKRASTDSREAWRVVRHALAVLDAHAIAVAGRKGPSVAGGVDVEVMVGLLWEDHRVDVVAGLVLAAWEVGQPLDLRGLWQSRRYKEAAYT